MNDLEQYLRDHREEFDTDEPRPGHLRRFEERLDGLHKKQGTGLRILPGLTRPVLLLRIAASVLVLVTAGTILFTLNPRGIREQFASAASTGELPQEVREAMRYYDDQAASMIESIHRIAATRPDDGDARALAAGELQSIDAGIVELRRTLAADPENEQVLDAILRSQQMKQEVLSSLLTQLSRVNTK